MEPPPRRRTARTGDASRRIDKRHLEKLIEEATIDAYNESEQRTGLFTMIDEHLETPFETEVLGVRVVVERVDLTVSDEIVAVCRRDGRRQRIPILDLPLRTPPPTGAAWIEAYRHWMKHGCPHQETSEPCDETRLGEGPRGRPGVTVSFPPLRQ